MTMMMMASSAQQQQYHHPPVVAEPKTSKLAMLPTSNATNVNGNAGSSVRQPYKHTTGSTREVSESDLIKWR